MCESRAHADDRASDLEPGGLPELLHAIAAIWCEILELDSVAVDDDFFARGGESLRAVHMLAAVEERSGVAISFLDFIEAPTLEALLARVTAHAAEPAGDGGLDGAPGLVSPDLSGDGPGPGSDGLGSAVGAEIAPCSYAQESLWALQVAGAGATYNEPIAVELTGALNVEALQAALNDLVRRHDALRTTIRADDGVPVLVIAPQAAVTLELTSASNPEELERDLRELAATPFALDDGPLLRARLIARKDDRHTLVLVLHHIITDGWSNDLLLAELGERYGEHHARRGATPVAPGARYAEFASEQRRALSGERLAAERDFWRAHLAGAGTVLDLGQRRSGVSAQTFAGETYLARLSGELAEEVNAACQREHVTPYVLLLAAFATLLYRRSGQDEILISGPMANREARFRDVIGFFANTMVVRISMTGNPSFRELLGRVRRSVLTSYEHQHAPLDLVIDAVGPPRRPGVTPLVQVNFRVRTGPLPAPEMPGLRSRRLALAPATARFELALELRTLPDGLEAELSWNTSLLAGVEMLAFLDDFERVLAAALRDPETRVLGLLRGGGAPSADVAPMAGSGIRGFRAGRPRN